MNGTESTVTPTRRLTADELLTVAALKKLTPEQLAGYPGVIEGVLKREPREALAEYGFWPHTKPVMLAYMWQATQNHSHAAIALAAMVTHLDLPGTHHRCEVIIDKFPSLNALFDRLSKKELAKLPPPVLRAPATAATPAPESAAPAPTPPTEATAAEPAPANAPAEPATVRPSSKQVIPITVAPLGANPAERDIRDVEVAKYCIPKLIARLTSKDAGNKQQKGERADAEKLLLSILDQHPHLLPMVKQPMEAGLFTSPRISAAIQRITKEPNINIDAMADAASGGNREWALRMLESVSKGPEPTSVPDTRKLPARKRGDAGKQGSAVERLRAGASASLDTTPNR